jgi:hypothetical protein
MIDSHNSQRMHPISMEETWMTTRWPNQVFCFLLAITVVNVQNAATHFLRKEKIDSLTARKNLAKVLIYNVYLVESDNSPRGTKWPRRGVVGHELLMLPNHQIFKNGILSPCKMLYQKQRCTQCTRKVRTYCSCTQGMISCMFCFPEHCVAVATANP